jgi:hypothetical protein
VPIGTDDSTDAGFEFVVGERRSAGPLRYFTDERVRAILPSIPFRRILTLTPLDDGTVTTYARFASRKARRRRAASRGARTRLRPRAA